MAFVKSNGTSVPHATNYSDLLDILVAFAVSTGSWQIVVDYRATAAGYIILKGLDYSGDKSIYIAIKKYANGGADTYGWIFQGYTGYTGAGFNLEPGAIGQYLPTLPLWNDSMPYWLSVNPRRIVLVTKISGIYVACYLGLLLPYGSTGQWQYPLVIGGSNISDVNGNGVPRYSDNSGRMCVPFIPIGDFNASGLVVRDSTGTWVRMYNTNKSITPPTNNQIGHSTAHGVSPYCDRNGEFNNNFGWRQLRPNLDGVYPLRNLRLMRGETPDALGILDGVKFTPGYIMSTEDTITEGADNYTVFQDTFRTDLYSFFALKES